MCPDMQNNTQNHPQNTMSRFRTPFKKDDSSTDVISRIDALIRKIDKLLAQ